MTSQHPGRLPASVYRRRRIVVGAALIAVIVVIVLLVIPRGGDDVTAPPTTPAPTDPETPQADDARSCAPSDISLTAVTDKASYEAGEMPMISMAIVNTSASACSYDVGTAQQLYSIVSGSDPIWNSHDCQQNPASLEQVLEPGVELRTEPFPWDRTRSSADTCDAARDPVIAGGATYRLAVSLGEATSDDDVPFLLH